MDSRMTACDGILGELVAYHFGTTPDVERDRLDAHLLGCTSCLRAYLRLKHQLSEGVGQGVGHGAAGGASVRPSLATRQRIRADVAAIVRPDAAARVGKILRRPIPLYQSLAVAAVAAGLAIGLPSLLEGFSNKPAQSAGRVDTSRPVGEAVAVY